MVEKDIPCRLCKSVSKSRLFTIEGEYPVVKCKNCGLVFIDRNFSEEELRKLYSADFFAGGADYFDERERLFMASKYLDEVGKFKKNDKLLEIGCAAGFLLKLARERGFDPHGVEISEYAAKFAREKLGLDVKNVTLEGAKFESKSFDVVIMVNVLEHLCDPLGTLQEINRILKDDGIALITVPNLNNAGLRFSYSFGGGNLFSKYHLTYFTSETLIKMCEASELKVVSLKTRFLTHYLFKLLELAHLSKKAISYAQAAELQNVGETKKSLALRVWNLVKKMDKTRFGVNIQVICEKRKM